MVYLYALLPFFNFLAGTGQSAERSWNGDFDGVRNLVAEYLEDQLGCVVRRHRLGFELVHVSGRTRSNVGAFLAALKLFYIVMREVGCYTAENPLVDVTSRVLCHLDKDEVGGDSDDPPRMPEVSGVEPSRSHRRLTDSFFKLVRKEWVPQIIDDPTFPVSVLSGGRKLRRWGLREECVTRLLFETGGRIFEVTGLTLGDWVNRGLTREATVVSKVVDRLPERACGFHARPIAVFDLLRGISPRGQRVMVVA